ncbi:MAG: cold-shock protein [Planctomycetota bacterium]
MYKGNVKWFSPSKGYGFISPDDESVDVFLHYSELDSNHKKIIRNGDKVSYDLTDGEKGPKALNVRLTEK